MTATINRPDMTTNRTARNPYVIAPDNAQHIDQLTVIRAHESWVRDLAISQDGVLLASAANDRTVRLWDLRAYEPELLYTFADHQGAVWSAVFSADDTLIASTSGDSLIRIWDITDQPYEFIRLADHVGAVYHAAFSPNGRLLASASHDHTVRLRDISKMRLSGRVGTGVMLNHISHVYSLSFSTDGSVRSRDSVIRLWEIHNTDLARIPQTQSHMVGHQSWVNCVVFMPGSTVLASGSHDQTVRLWDTRQQVQLQAFHGHQESVTAVAFSPDNDLIASGSKDHTVRIWSVSTGQELACIQQHTSVNAVVFSPDGTRILFAGGDGLIHVWGLP